MIKVGCDKIPECCDIVCLLIEEAEINGEKGEDDLHALEPRHVYDVFYSYDPIVYAHHRQAHI